LVQDDSYYLNLGYEYARRRKELDRLNEEKQDLLALSIRVKRDIEEADKVIATNKKAKNALKDIYYRNLHEHDHDNDPVELTADGKRYIKTIYGIPHEIQRLIDDPKISPQEFKKMDIVHKTKWGEFGTGIHKVKVKS
jgi:hypothetical protein